MKMTFQIAMLLTFLFFCQSLIFVQSHLDETQALKELNTAILIDGNNQFQKTIRLRNKILESFISQPKSLAQHNFWVNRRDLLRQTALQTLAGTSALCGEISRVLIKMLRAKNIRARRLYVYGEEGTAHVLFEYYDGLEKQWIAVNSFNNIDYLGQLLSVKTTAKKLFSKADSEKLIYDKFSNLNYQLVAQFGYQHDIPYILSYFMDEVYLLRALASLVLCLFCLALGFLLK
jgi:hypothetical protein